LFFSTSLKYSDRVFICFLSLFTLNVAIYHYNLLLEVLLRYFTNFNMLCSHFICINIFISLLISFWSTGFTVACCLICTFVNFLITPTADFLFYNTVVGKDS
jgi:hypothetical protein